MTQKKFKKVSKNISPEDVTQEHINILNVIARGVILANASSILLEDKLPENHFKASEAKFAYNELLKAVRLYETRMRKNADHLYKMFGDNTDVIEHIYEFASNISEQIYNVNLPYLNLTKENFKN